MNSLNIYHTDFLSINWFYVIFIGSRSGDVTPGGSSRPGSALSTATSTSGVVYRRPASARKPRPASIAGTGMTQESK